MLTRHLPDSDIALAAQSDLPLAAQLYTRAHCLVCASCRSRLEAYRADRARVRMAVEAFSLPRSVNMASLEEEMFANIRVGLEVNEIFEPKREAREQATFSWRGAAAIAALTAIVMTGWYLGAGPGRYMLGNPSAVARVDNGELVLHADEYGVGLEARGRGIVLRNASSNSARFEVGLEGSVRTSAVDADSGQVTVSQVYVE
jgi:hypothetical protein